MRFKLRTLASSVVTTIFMITGQYAVGQATDLFFSEYIEGSASNKYLEVFNGTGATVDLSDYELQLFSNGATSASNTNSLTGLLADGAVIVYANAGATIYGGATTAATACGFNGDDAIGLYKISTASFVDIIGNIGCDPGSRWEDGGVDTQDQTLVRNASVCGGITSDPGNSPCAFPTIASEWTEFGQDDFSDLGSHTASCGGVSITTVQFVSTSNSVTEEDAGYSLTLSILNPSATVATTCEVAISAGTASRIANYTTQTVTWPAGDNTDKTISVNITDNGACDGLENFVFDIQNVLGGESAVLGINTTFTSELDDNESKPVTSFEQGGETGDSWGISSGAGNLSTAVGGADTPANERILTGTNSWQVSNTTGTLELSTESVLGVSNASITARLSSTSTTSGNGNDGSDFVEFYVNLDGAGFPATPDVRINGNSNAKWGFSNGNSVASTTAGTPIVRSPSPGGNTSDGYSYIVIDIPNGSSTVALRVVAQNNSSSEYWNLDEFRINAEGCFPVYFSQGNGTEIDPIWSTDISGTGGTVPFDQNASMVIRNGHNVTLNANSLNVYNVDVQVGGSLDIGPDTLHAYGTEVNLDGTFDNEGTLVLDNVNEAVSLSGNSNVKLASIISNADNLSVTIDSLSITETLALNNGSFDATSSDVVLVSDAAGTGRLAALAPTASYIGDITVQRFIPAGVTNWRAIGSPVQGQIIDDWNDDFFTTGFDGSDGLLVNGVVWPNILSYDETNIGPLLEDGLQGPTDSSDVLAPGQGFAAWIGDTLQGTNSLVLDLTGVPNTGTISFPLTYTSTGDMFVDGWNLVSNPYASPIDFTAINRGADVTNNYYVYDPVSGNNATWSELLQTSVPEFALSGNIQSSQSFWLHAIGSNFATTVDESAKTDTLDGGLFGGSQIQNIIKARVKISSGMNSYYDETMLVFANGAANFESNDVQKMIFNNGSSPQIASETSDGITTAINDWGSVVGAISIPLQVNVPITGSYTLTLFDAQSVLGMSCVTIEDTETGLITPMVEGGTYTFTIGANAPSSPARFILHASAPAALSNIDATCFGYSDGEASLLNPTNDLWTVEWKDNLGTTIQTQTVSNGTATIQNLAEGNYTVSVTGGCGLLNQPFDIGAPTAMGAAGVVSDATCNSSSDAQIDLIPQGGIAPLNFAWSNGATSEDLLGIGVGNYSVIISDANGCDYVHPGFSVVGGAGPTAVATASSTNVLVGEEIEFYGLATLGSNLEWDMGDGTFYYVDEPLHTFNTPGIFSVEFKAEVAGCETITTLDIDVSTSTSVEEVQAQNVSAFVNEDNIMVSWNSSGYTATIMDLTGRVVREAITLNGDNGTSVISLAGESAGLYFLLVSNKERTQTIRLPYSK